MIRPRPLLLGLLAIGIGGCTQGGSPDLVSFCAAYAEYQRFGFADSPDQNDPAEVQASFEGTRSRIEAIRDEAPSEIADDVATLVQQFDTVQQALEDADYDLASVRDEVSATFDDPENTAARERVGAFNAEQCDEGSSGPTPSQPAPASS